MRLGMGRLALARKHPTCRACHAGFKIWVAELELLVGWGGAHEQAGAKHGGCPPGHCMVGSVALAA